MSTETNCYRSTPNAVQRSRRRLSAAFSQRRFEAGLKHDDDNGEDDIPFPQQQNGSGGDSNNDSAHHRHHHPNWQQWQQSSVDTSQLPLQQS
jgi:hypothetical protein